MRISILILLLVLHGISWGQTTGKLFPSIKGETLEGKVVTVPEDTKGKYTLIGMAYSQKSEDQLKTWFQPAFSAFIDKSKPSLFEEKYDVNLYFIPMFTGINKAATATAKKKALEGVDKRLHAYILFYKGELEMYKKELGLSQKDTPYFFVLDKDGKIVYSTEGSYSDEKMEAIENILGEE